MNTKTTAVAVADALLAYEDTIYVRFQKDPTYGYVNAVGFRLGDDA